MVDVAMPAPAALAAAPSGRAKALARKRAGDALFERAAFAAAIAVLLLMGAITLSLVVGAWPSIVAFGPNFLFTQEWNPVKDVYGGGASIYGTIVTSVLALLLAGPIGIGIAIFLTELCPHSLRRPIGAAIELLAGIPSIIFGVWGLFVLVPILQSTVQPALIALFGPVPVLSTLFSGAPYGIGMLSSAFVLGIMVLPFVTAVARDVFEATPPLLKEAAYGIGCTRWETASKVVLPFARVGVTGGLILALGRALGETMAVTFVIGNAHRISASLLAPGTSISATIANEFTEATTDLYRAALIELGLILFAITFVALLLARWMLKSMDRSVVT